MSARVLAQLLLSITCSSNLWMFCEKYFVTSEVSYVEEQTRSLTQLKKFSMVNYYGSGTTLSRGLLILVSSSRWLYQETARLGTKYIYLSRLFLEVYRCYRRFVRHGGLLPLKTKNISLNISFESHVAAFSDWVVVSARR